MQTAIRHTRYAFFALYHYLIQGRYKIKINKGGA